MDENRPEPESAPLPVPAWVFALGTIAFFALVGYGLFRFTRNDRDAIDKLNAALEMYQQGSSQIPEDPTGLGTQRNGANKTGNEGALAGSVDSTKPKSKDPDGTGGSNPNLPARPGSKPGVEPASPFGPGTTVIPPALGGDLPSLPVPGPDGPDSAPEPVPQEQRVELLVYRISTAHADRDKDLLSSAALEAGGFSQHFQDFLGTERLLELDGLLIYVPTNKLQMLSEGVAALSGRLEDQWRGPFRDRQAEIERPQRTVLARLLADRGLLLKDYEEDAPVIKDLDVEIEKVRESFRLLRPSRDVRTLVAFRITFLEEGN